MKSHQTIFNKTLSTVTISEEEYRKLLQYKEFALEMREVLQGDAEWVGTIPQYLTLNIQIWCTLNAHTTTNVLTVNMTAEMIKNANRNQKPTHPNK